MFIGGNGSTAESFEEVVSAFTECEAGKASGNKFLIHYKQFGTAIINYIGTAIISYVMRIQYEPHSIRTTFIFNIPII